LIRACGRRSAAVLLTALVAPCASTAAGDAAHREWRTYAGDPGAAHYSPLDQIDVANVHTLEVAWRYHTGDAEPKYSQMQCNPIAIGDTLYVTSPKLKVIALDAATGRERWRFDPYAGIDAGQGINRGVSWWEDGTERRILFTAGPWLYALDADDGRPIERFGADGRVDLRAALGRDPDRLQVDATTPGAVFEDLIVLGSRVGETPAAAPGQVSAFDVRTGRLRWVFHTIAHPGEYGHDTWPADAWRRVGGANAWSAITVDPTRGMLFVPTGAPSYDFYGGNRAGHNLFANSVIALEARSGRRVWHFQTVHHDLWDRDVAAPPGLVSFVHEGRRIDAVAQPTKGGYLFVLDRDTGTPVFPVEERPVPASDVDGEAAAPTQPIPERPPPFTRQRFGEAEQDALPDATRAYVRERLRGLRAGQAFLPPSTRGTVLFPGTNGGAGWGGAAFDPETGYLYVNATEIPSVITLTDVTAISATPARTVYLRHCAGCHGLDRRGDGREYPSLLGAGQKYSYVSIADIIRHGKGRMPGFSGFRFEDILLLLDYLNLPAGADDAPADDAPDRDAEDLEVPYLHTGYEQLFDRDGVPGVSPPWGTLTAIDLARAWIAWQVPLGEYPALAARGLRHTGTENFGGPIVTGGGLVFIAATMDEKIRAFDKTNGKLLWEALLPAAGFAIPSTYETGGRQYLVIAAGGGKGGLQSGDSYVAFALPADPARVAR
jgi:quinoprotein glucose dehydrogenase